MERMSEMAWPYALPHARQWAFEVFINGSQRLTARANESIRISDSVKSGNLTVGYGSSIPRMHVPT